MGSRIRSWNSKGRRGAWTATVASAALATLLMASQAPSVFGATESGNTTPQEVIVAARDLVFEPDVIRASAETELTILLTNAGQEPHNIAFTFESGEPIEPGAVSPIITAGESVRVTFTTPGPGRYPFLCQVHPLVMTGTLRIDGEAAEPEPRPAAPPSPPPLADHPRVDPTAFQITTFASGLPYTTAMLELADGSLLVAVNEADDAGFIGSTGKFLRMNDENADGVADATTPVGIVAPAGGQGPLVLQDLPGAVIQMRDVGDLVVLTTRQRSLSHLVVMRAGQPGDHLRLLGTMTLEYPRAHVHHTNGIAVREAETPGSVEVYFNVGSRLNDQSDAAPIAATGLVEAALEPESIYRVTLTDDGESVRASDPRLIATGVRNGAGMAFHPRSGDLYFQDNGIDLEDGSEDQLSADELNVIAADRLGREVFDFGFPDDYVAAESGEKVGSGAELPVLTFQPIDGSASEGPAEIVFAPPGFPGGLQTGLFVGFHGFYNEAGLDNTENPLLYVDLEGRTLVPFVPNEAPDIGHLDNLLSTADSLFLADINRLGPVGTPDAEGVIYRVKALGTDGD